MENDKSFCIFTATVKRLGAFSVLQVIFLVLTILCQPLQHANTIARAAVVEELRVDQRVGRSKSHFWCEFFSFSTYSVWCSLS